MNFRFYTDRKCGSLPVLALKQWLHIKYWYIVNSFNIHNDRASLVSKKFKQTKKLTRPGQLNIERNKEPLKKAQQDKILQARFDSACSWTVMESANYRTRPLRQIVQCTCTTPPTYAYTISTVTL
jgi:hypothetical protein